MCLMPYANNTGADHSILRVSKFLEFLQQVLGEPRHDKTNKVTVPPAKTQISLASQADLSLCWVHTHFVGVG